MLHHHKILEYVYIEEIFTQLFYRIATCSFHNHSANNEKIKLNIYSKNNK